MLFRRLALSLGGGVLAVVMLLATSFTACAQSPITIGFGMALTGGLAPNGKAALFAMQIWEKEINAKTAPVLAMALKLGTVDTFIRNLHGKRA